jgi:hypothetical protein
LLLNYGNAEPMVLEPDGPRTAEQAGDIPEKIDCVRKGPTSFLKTSFLLRFEIVDSRNDFLQFFI